MEAFVKAFRNINYEFFGLILPGLFAILGIGGLILLDYIALGKVSPEEVSKYYHGTVEPNWYIAFSALLLGTYLGGHFLKLVSKYGILSVLPIDRINFGASSVAKWKIWSWMKGVLAALTIEPLWLKFLFLLGKTNPKLSHRESYADLEAELRSQLQQRLKLTAAAKSIERWNDFYVVAKTFVGSKGQESLIANYQAKYTFHRSLASLFALTFWTASASVVLLSRYEVQIVWIYLMTGSAVFSFVFLKHFVMSFSEFWRLFGDIVLAELSVALALEDKMP